MYESSHELPSDVRLTKFQENPWNAVFDGEHPTVHPKVEFWLSLVKNYKKSAVKHSIEKSYFA